MNFLSWANEKNKKLDWFDMVLTKISCFAFGVILVKFIPGLIEVNIWLIVAIWLIFAVRPLYRFFK